MQSKISQQKFKEIIELWQKSTDKKKERKRVEIQKGNIKIEELKAELGNKEVYFMSEEEVKFIHKEVFWNEVLGLTPFNELKITEWTQVLQDI